VSATVGDEIDFTLGTVGLGSYDSLPTISSTGVRFIDDSLVGNTTTGVTQLFRFLAVGRGTAIIVFRRSGGPIFSSSDTVRDTVVVH
jgi:hypothetical protein